MKKLLSLATLAIVLSITLVLPVSAAEAEGSFNITEYPSTAAPDKIGATVEAYRFVYDADSAGNKMLTGEYVHSLPKLTYETETAQKINQKIIDDFNELHAELVWLMIEEHPSDDGTNYFNRTNYTSLIDGKGIVVIIVEFSGGLMATCASYLYYRVYYYSPETDSELSVDEYLTLYGTSREEISARFSDENDGLKCYDPETDEIANVPAEDINFAIYYADGTETVCADVPDMFHGKYTAFFGNRIEFAPQTGFATVAYVAVAVVSAATAVAVTKKRRR